MLLGCLVFIFQYVILPFVFVLIFREILGLMRLRRYKVQGIVTKYFPIVGGWKRLILNISSNDIAKDMKQERVTHYGEDFIVWNNGIDTSCFVELISPRALREFYLEDTKVSVKEDITKLKVGGLFFQNGEIVDELKSHYAEIFRRENLERVSPVLFKIISTHCQNLKNKWQENNQEWMQMNIKEFVFKVMKDFSLIFLLGITDPQQGLKNKNGKPLLEDIEELGNIMWGFYFYSPFSIMIGNIFQRLRIDPKARRMDKLKKEISEVMFKEFFERKKVKKLIFLFLAKSQRNSQFHGSHSPV